MLTGGAWDAENIGTAEYLGGGFNGKVLEIAGLTRMIGLKMIVGGALIESLTRFQSPLPPPPLPPLPFPFPLWPPPLAVSQRRTKAIDRVGIRPYQNQQVSRGLSCVCRIQHPGSLKRKIYGAQLEPGSHTWQASHTALVTLGSNAANRPNSKLWR